MDACSHFMKHFNVLEPALYLVTLRTSCDIKILHFNNVLALISFHTFRRHLRKSALFRSGFLLSLGDRNVIATGSFPPEGLRAPH